MYHNIIQIIKTMETFNITLDSYTNIQLIKLYSKNNDHKLLNDLMTSEVNKKYVTNYMFSEAIKSCNNDNNYNNTGNNSTNNYTHNNQNINIDNTNNDNERNNGNDNNNKHDNSDTNNNNNDYKNAIKLLQKACQLNKADEAVFTITAKICYQQKQYIKSFKIIDAMILRGLPLNKYSFSFLLNSCLEYQINGGNALNYIEKYINLAYHNYPTLITNSVCQKVMRDLLLANQPYFAATLHAGNILTLV